MYQSLWYEHSLVGSEWSRIFQYPQHIPNTSPQNSKFNRFNHKNLSGFLNRIELPCRGGTPIKILSLDFEHQLPYVGRDSLRVEVFLASSSSLLMISFNLGPMSSTKLGLCLLKWRIYHQRDLLVKGWAHGRNMWEPINFLHSPHESFWITSQNGHQYSSLNLSFLGNRKWIPFPVPKKTGALSLANATRYQ